ncbi:MAG: transketolase family protein [Lachnospiraceae bacterium]|nr:transketolase family protein [Lachnospiraceae bacterium]
MLSTREAYGQALADIGETCDFFVLDADLSKATQTVHFAKKFPERFLNMGIAEGNMMDFAAGISTCGVPVFASTFAAFAAGRAYDQIRNGIAYPNCNVKIGATHGGVLIGADGGSHQCIEDIALMRAIPNMTVLCPCDKEETYACVKAALAYEGPVYLRFGRLGSPEVYKEGTLDFAIGKGQVICDGTDVTLIAIGDMVSRCCEAQKLLEAEGIHAAVLDMASIKPIDAELICKFAEKTGCIVTVEDHNVMGGMGSAVAEVLAKNCPTPVEFVGIQDQFGRSGTPEDLAERYGLTAGKIAEASKKIIEKKG